MPAAARNEYTRPAAGLLADDFGVGWGFLESGEKNCEGAWKALEFVCKGDLHARRPFACRPAL